MPNIQIRTGDVLHALRKKWKIIIISLVTGLILGLFLVGVQFVRGGRPDYEINGSFAVSARGSSGKYTGNYETPNDFYLAQDMVDAVSYVLSSRKVMSDMIKQLNLKGYSPSFIASSLIFEKYNETQIVEVTLRWQNEQEGVKIMNYIFKQAEKVIPNTLQAGDIAVVNPPEANRVGNGSTYFAVILLSIILGGATGFGMILLELIIRPTLLNEKDMESDFGIESIGVIPQIDKKLITADPDDKETESAFSSAAYILRNLIGKKAFYVTSSVREEGRSYVAANIALHLSKMEKKVLLIDMDITSPSISKMFNTDVEYCKSLNALYREEALVDEVICHINGYLDLIPSVREHNQIALSQELQKTILDFYEKYDYVVIDAAPVEESSDVLGLNQLTDTALFVVKYDNTTIPNIKDAVDKLDKSGTRILGCVINFADKKKKTSKKKKEEQDHDVDDMVKGNTSFFEDASVYDTEERETTDRDLIHELIKIGLEEDDAGE